MFSSIIVGLQKHHSKRAGHYTIGRGEASLENLRLAAIQVCSDSLRVGAVVSVVEMPSM